MRLLLRILGLFIEPLIIPVVVMVGSIYFFTETTAGLQTALHIASKSLPGKLQVQQVEGKLFSEFTLHGVTYQDASMSVTVGFLRLDWNPKALLETKLYLRQLIARNVEIKKLADDNNSLSLDQIRFYLKHVRANQVEVSNLNFVNGKNPPVKIMALNVNQVNVENFTFSARLSNGDIQGIIASEWNARWHFQVPDLNTLVPQAQGAVALTGTITGARNQPVINADLEANKLVYNDDKINQLTGKVNLTIKPNSESSASLTASGIQINKKVFKKIDVALSAKTTSTADKLATNIIIALNQKPYFTVTLNVPKQLDFSQLSQVPIYAKINIDNLDLKMLAQYAPEVKNLNGKIYGNLILQGTLNTPHINGEMTLAGGNVSIPKLGTTFKNITLHATGDESKHLDYTGSLQSGKGDLQIKGSTDFAQAHFPSTLTLSGKNLQLVNLEEYKIIASPELTAALSDNVISIKGNVFIPEAKIAPKNFNGVVTLPADVVFVGEKTPKRSSMMDALPALQVNVTLGDKIYLHYQDLEAMLKGSVVITKDASSPATGIGSLYTSKGTYSAYKKILTIKEGRLLYTGNLITNPGLNIKASREMKAVQTGSMSDFSSDAKTQVYTGMEKLTVGVQVLGTLDKPVISLFSEPTLSQVDVLSYLILGVPSAQTTGNNKQSLLAAASSLSLGGDSGGTSLGSITKNIQKTFGLTELNVESVQSFDQKSGGAVGTTSLVLGKQIAPNLYVHYSTSFDLSNPVSTFNLRYKLSKRFSIQSETSTIDTGADLLYSIERG
jgi:translocation and assembly module TamB